MGNYLTYAPPATNDLKDGLSEVVLASILSDLATDAEKLVTVNQRINAAESEVDSYLGARYPVPLAAPPESVVNAALVLAVLGLYRRTATTPEDAVKAADEVRAWLKAVALGTVVLDLADAEENSAPAVTTGTVLYDTQERQVTREAMGVG